MDDSIEVIVTPYGTIRADDSTREDLLLTLRNVSRDNRLLREEVEKYDNMMEGIQALVQAVGL